MADTSMWTGSDKYLCDAELAQAFHMSRVLGMPLLMEGEPGTGKTRLAHHIAWIFKLGRPLIFNAQTSSTVKDIFYKYDALGHFQFSQTSKELLVPTDIERRFITYHSLGKAIKENKRFVVLIDEINRVRNKLEILHRNRR